MAEQPRRKFRLPDTVLGIQLHVVALEEQSAPWRLHHPKEDCTVGFLPLLTQATVKATRKSRNVV